MKSTTNVFLKGLNTDLHPMTVGSDQLTDALNATFITYNGNELVLQNDMGNTRIQDRITGSVMGLKEGFIPMAMKEHGGILYIASYNPYNNLSELGSIPSPLFDYSYTQTDLTFCNKKLMSSDYTVAETPIILDQADGGSFYVGDGVQCGLKIKSKPLNDNQSTPFSTLQRKYTLQLDSGKEQTEYISYPLISTREQTGLLTLHAMSIPSRSVSVCDLNYHVFGPNKLSNQWFYDIGKQDSNSVDTIVYPNIQSGRLAVKPVLQSINNVEILQNNATQLPEPYYVMVDGTGIIITYQCYKYSYTFSWKDFIGSSQGPKSNDVQETTTLVSGTCPITLDIESELLHYETQYIVNSGTPLEIIKCPPAETSDEVWTLKIPQFTKLESVTKTRKVFIQNKSQKVSASGNFEYPLEQYIITKVDIVDTIGKLNKGSWGGVYDEEVDNPMIPNNKNNKV